jgi:hypothetical protein
MPVYSAFGRPSEPAEFIAEKFSWAAFLLPPLFALWHRLWLVFVALVVAIVALFLLSTVISDAAAFGLYALVALWCGFAAPDLRRFALRKKWHEHVPVVAADADSAEWRLLEREAQS